MKLQPFVDTILGLDVLDLAIQARTLDVEASPYDATSFGAGVVPVETKEGRRIYRARQRMLMDKAEPIRRRLLQAYDSFLSLAFEEDLLRETAIGTKGTTTASSSRQSPVTTIAYASPERFAQAEPGGLPWRRSLIPSETTSAADTTSPVSSS